MKVLAELRLYNYAMRERRQELGLSQWDLVELSGVPIDIVGKVERLQRPPRSRIGTMNEKLMKIANALDLPFETLFPKDYLEMIERELLPKSTRYRWVREVSLESLPGPTPHPALIDERNLTEQVERDELAESIEEAIQRLSDRERLVIELHYGLKGKRRHTLGEIGRIIKGRGGNPISKAAVMQVKNRAIRKLKHPMINKPIREMLFRRYKRRVNGNER